MSRLCNVAAALLLLCVTNTARAVERVGLHLVLALDCSDSVTPERWRAQLLGYSRALRDPQIVAALSRGVGITVVVWSGPDEQMQALPWIRVYDAASALPLTLAIERIPKVYGGYTNIGSGIDFSTQLLIDADPQGLTKRVIDISGDGQHRESPHPNAQRGVPLETARARAHANDITINGLPIEGDEGGISDYYREHVIVGYDAFIETVSDPDDTSAFGRAIHRKLLREILASVR